jgi:hypothetical protein
MQGKSKNPVTRPVKIHGNITMVLSPVTDEASLIDWGEATHAGRYINTGRCVLNAAGEFIAGEGHCIVSSGESFDWMIGDTPNWVV